MKTKAVFFAFAVLLIAGFVPLPSWAAGPPVPAGPHPRLFMSTANVTAFSANAALKGTAANALVARCQETIDSASRYSTRGGSDGDNWPGAALACAFSYTVTKNESHLAQAIKYWKVALNDDQKIGDALGCVAGVKNDWQSWNGSSTAPPIILTVTHDTGYPIRWYGPDIALTYDWLYNAPGVDDALKSQTRTCLGAWVDWYSKSGYLRNSVGANYNAGFVIAKAMAAIAIGSDGGADGHLWTEIQTLFSDLLIGVGLAGSKGEVGTPAGVLVGGDWMEAWQYGPLSVLEYAIAARALEESGVPLPEMDAWTNSMILRYIHGTLPPNDAQYVGNGDFDSDKVYQVPTANTLDAVLAGPSSDQAAAWAKWMKDLQKAKGSSGVWNAIGELRNVTAKDYTAQTPPPALWYLARGTRTIYARTSWTPTAFWTAFTSPPELVDDHHHFAASNFVFSRGGDYLIVDGSNYGQYGTISTNAVSADSAIAKGEYQGSQTGWSKADLPWARGADSGVVAGRSDFAKAFIYSSTASDIPYAHREFVFLPEGEIVLIDRVRTNDASRKMYVQFHVKSGGTLKLQDSVASGTVGSSRVAIHTVALSGGTPTITQPPVGECASCQYPCGRCESVRFALDKFKVQVPGPNALAIHVIDGLDVSESPATVGSLNDDTYDPAPKQNAGVIGAAVNRSSKQSYVVASSAQDGAAVDPMIYSVPGAGPSRHIVFDAPEADSGKSDVSATVSGTRCVLKLTKGTATGLTGRPLMFQVSAASEGCKVTENTNVASSVPPTGGGVSADAGTRPPTTDALLPPPASQDASVPVSAGQDAPVAIVDGSGSTPVVTPGTTPDAASINIEASDGGLGPEVAKAKGGGCGCVLAARSPTGTLTVLWVLGLLAIRPAARMGKRLCHRKGTRLAEPHLPVRNRLNRSWCDRSVVPQCATVQASREYRGLDVGYKSAYPLVGQRFQEPR